jgi:signal transduction histidine kinase/CheY-like chemotaxis protein
LTTARTATLLTVFFAFLCILQVSLIAQTLDKTRSQLSSKSTGAMNSLTQIDRSFDQFSYALVAHRLRSAADTTANNTAPAPAYRDKFEILWASVTVLNLRTPGTTEKMPAATELMDETQQYLNTYDPLVNGDQPLTDEQTSKLYSDTMVLAEKFHALTHDYFLALAKFSDELKGRTQRLYQTFIAFAIMVLTCGGVSLYSLFKANRKSEQMIAESNQTQARLSQVVDELRSGKLENKAKDSFLAAASHDLRQPLHALGLFLGALEKHVKPTGHAIMKNAQESSSALTRLLSSLLDLSRLDAGAVKVQHRRFNIGKLITTLEHEFQPTATLRGMTLDFDSRDQYIYSDRILIDRVLRNLIENSLTHSHGSKLELRTLPHEDYLALEVVDDGIGILKCNQDDIFSEYFQIGNPERDRSKGLGIGLAIVKRLSELLGLNLQLRSDTRAGCRFTLQVPLATTQSAQTTTVDLPASGSDHDREIVVGVIEDEKGVREGMQVMLNSKGYTALIADSAESLLKLVEQRRQMPDVLVSDYRLRHGTTGDHAIRVVAEKLHKHIPAVIITGDTSPKRVKELTRSGYKLMHKPVEPQDLLVMIDQLAEPTTRETMLETTD